MSVVLSPRLDLHHDVLDELSSGLFTSMGRSDQRRKGMCYLYGLLTTPGRKSMRNVAAAVGGHATEQSLHHFISDSTWDWIPVREALTDYTVSAMPPRAWVVRPMVIPKAGNDSVGVGRRFCPSHGQALNAQHALGVWAASDEVSSPVNWRLHLPRTWLRDERKRSRASIPDGVDEESITDCVVEAYLEVASRPGVPLRPVVFDARCLDIEHLTSRLGAVGLPWLVRIGTNHQLTTDDVRLPGLTSGATPAYRLIGALRSARRLLSWTDHEPIPTTRTDLVAAVRVGLPTEPGADTVPDLHLIGTGPVGHPWPAQLWLTDLGDSTPLGALLHLAKLGRPGGPGRGRRRRPGGPARLQRPFVRRVAPPRDAGVRGARALRVDGPGSTPPRRPGCRGHPRGRLTPRLAALSRTAVRAHRGPRPASAVSRGPTSAFTAGRGFTERWHDEHGSVVVVGVQEIATSSSSVYIGK
nr:transposase [Saccharothrix sp. NRRL B-16348]